jgi:DNA-directed RNA polymerase specialized sigma24 family protein
MLKNDDLTLLEALRAGATEALGVLHDRYLISFRQDLCAAFRQCSPAEADDLFIETLVKLEDRVRRGGLTELYDGGLPGWMAVTGRNFYLKRHAKKPVIVTDELPDPGADDEDPFAGEEQARLLRIVRTALTELGDPCSWLLDQFYLQAASTTSIADASQGRYRNRQVVKKERWRCMNRLRALVFNGNSKNQKP